MAAPEKTYNQITLDDGLEQNIQWVAPVIDGVTSVTNLSQSYRKYDAGYVFEWPATQGALFGARKPLPAARDLSGSRFIWLAGFSIQFGTVLKFADLVDGGLRFYITDSAGASKGWTIYGRDISGQSASPTFAFGNFLQFSNSLSQMWWCIDLGRTPDYSGGTLDLTDIVAIEIHIQNSASISNQNAGTFACGFLLASDKAIIRAGEVANPASFAILPGTLGRWSEPSNPLYPGGARTQELTPIGDGANGNLFQPICPVQVGDGSTATYFRQSRGQIAMQPSMEAIKYRLAQGETPSLLPVYLPNDVEDCTHTINQSASDDVEIADFVWSAYDYPARGYALEVTGSTSGTCAFVSNSFFRAQFINLGHATTTDCIFDACGPVRITSATGITAATIRNAPSGVSALIITGSAGDYSNVDVRLNNPSATHDIELGSGGAGNYDLSGVIVPSGYTLKIRNNSSNNITVTISAGITTSTSTAGGTITILQPPTTLNILRPNFLEGSTYVLRNSTEGVELDAGTVGSGGLDITLTSGVDYTPGDDLDLRVGYVSGTTAKLPIQELITAPSGNAANSAPTTQQDYAVYNTLAIDGSTRTEFAADYVNKQIDITVASDFSGQNFMAWWVYNESTLNGLRAFLGAYTLLDEGNARNNASVVSVKFDNTTTSNIKQIDNARIFASDGSYPVVNPSTGGGSIDINWRVPVQIISVEGSPVVTGSLEDVPSKVQQGMTDQGYTSARAVEIGKIKAKTDNLPDQPSSKSDVEEAAFL